MTTKISTSSTPQVPDKIAEIISYLAHDFAKNHLFESEDLQQDLYLLYFNMLKDKPELATQKPGYFFIKFKWHLLTKWRKKVNTLNKEWVYKVQQIKEAGIKDPMEHLGYKTDPYIDTEIKSKRKPKYKKYNF